VGGGGEETLTVSRHVVALQMKDGTGRVPKSASRIAMRVYNSWEDFSSRVKSVGFSVDCCLLRAPRGEATLCHGLFVRMRCDVLYEWPQWRQNCQ
jgi:hypothetical protein